LVNKKENVFHAFLEAQRTHGFIVGEKGTENDDVGLGHNRS
jgi:hypothetical protein